MKDELIKYKLLNIFFDRTEELKYLKLAVKREKRYLSRHEKGYYRWLLDQRKEFHDFIRSIEKNRRRNCQRMRIPDRMKMWSLEEAISNQDRLKLRLNEFSIAVRKRILMIEHDWDRLTAFFILMVFLQRTIQLKITFHAVANRSKRTSTDVILDFSDNGS